MRVILLLLLIISVFSLQTFSAEGHRFQQLFSVADTDPSYEELGVWFVINDSKGDVNFIQVYSGRDQLYSRSTEKYYVGSVIQKYFLTITNISFYPDRGGRLNIRLGRLSVDLDVLRVVDSKTQQVRWEAQVKGRAIQKVTVEVRRMMGVPVGINEAVPLQILYR